MMAEIESIQKQTDGISVRVNVDGRKESIVFSPKQATTANIQRFIDDVAKMREEDIGEDIDVALNRIKHLEKKKLDIKKGERL